MKKHKFDYGHLKSQKFAGLVLGMVACFCAGLFLVSEPTTSAVIMGIVALYGTFVGGRAFSDGQALKFGGGQVDPAPPKPPVAAVPPKKVVPPITKKESEDESS